MWAKIRGLQPDKRSFEQEFHFVASDQADLAQNKISIDSPLGRVLSGAKVGDKAQLETKIGMIELIILELGRG
jgi:transcription elongation factor GreA